MTNEADVRELAAEILVSLTGSEQAAKYDAPMVIRTAFRLADEFYSECAKRDEQNGV